MADRKERQFMPQLSNGVNPLRITSIFFFNLCNVVFSYFEANKTKKNQIRKANLEALARLIHGNELIYIF